jgi:hypothetical protein
MLAAEADEGLKAAFSGEEMTQAQKALARLVASKEWQAYTQPQRDQLTAEYQRIDAIQRETEAWKEKRKEIEKEIEVLKRLEEEQQKASEQFTRDLGAYADDNDALQRRIALVGQDNLAHEKLIETLEKERLIRKALLTADDPVAAIEAIEAQFKRRIELMDELTAASERFQDAQRYNQIFADAFADNVSAIADGTKSIKEAFEDMGRSIASTINRIIAQKLADQLFGVGPGQTGGLGSMLSGLFGTAGSGGGGFDIGQMLSLFGQSVGFRAGGGPVAANMPYVVGEKEPELFVPRTAGTIIPQSKMGSNVTVNQSIYVQGTVDSRTQRQIASAAGAAVSGAGVRG